MTKTEHEIWATVQAMNRCWTCGDNLELEKLQDFFHDRMVAITPADRCRVEGKEACIAGWSNFAKTVTIRQWTEQDARVIVYNQAAVVTYYYDLAGDTHGQPVSFAGRDMLTLIREDGRWQVVADQFSPFPQQCQGATA